MKKNKIIILADSPILNPTIVKPISNLSVSYNIYLNSLLFLNWMEILAGLNENFNIISILSEKDKEYIPKDFFLPDIQNLFFNRQNLEGFLDEIPLLPFANESKNLIIFYNSIGFKQSDIERVFKLIQVEETSVVIAKSKRNKIILTCSYGLDRELVDSLQKSKRDYTKYLNFISNKDIFIHTLEDFLSIDDFEDIKKLYIELSKKESLSYCSQIMHESFNDLFVEYKEQLNV
jgi:hypothetical protein